MSRKKTTKQATKQASKQKTSRVRAEVITDAGGIPNPPNGKELPSEIINELKLYMKLVVIAITNGDTLKESWTRTNAFMVPLIKLKDRIEVTLSPIVDLKELLNEGDSE